MKKVKNVLTVKEKEKHLVVNVMVMVDQLVINATENAQ